MEKLLHDLGGIVLNALPTAFIVLILSIFVRQLYLKPLEAVLAERNRLSDGARKAAEEGLHSADSKIAEYQGKLEKARGEIYAEQAEFLRNLHAEQTARAQSAKAASDASLASARQALAAEAAEARGSLAAQTEQIAAEIADSVLGAEGIMILAEEVNELWKWPNFLLLVGLFGYLIKKHGAPLLETRSKQIREDLEAGQKAKAEAEARAAAVQAKIANLDREIAELRGTAHTGLEQEAERIRREAEAEMSRIEQHAAVEIVSMGKHVRLELRQYAAGLALDLAEHKIRGRMSPDAQSALLDNFAGDIAGRAAGSGGSAHA